MGKNKVEDEVQNKQIIFRDYLIGYPQETDLYICTTNTIKLQVPQGSKSVLVKNMYLSCDPTMQFLMRKDESPLSGSYKYITGSLSDVNMNILKLKLLIYFWLNAFLFS
jgi:NADPH-dependent curcumin reductase CurA